jgi:hypothetical protein
LYYYPLIASFETSKKVLTSLIYDKRTQPYPDSEP